MSNQQRSWQEAQNQVSQFLQRYHFSIRQEVTLASGRRIDIVAQKRINDKILHLLIEVKNWEKVTRKQESVFCQQLQKYLIEYTIGELSKRKNQKSKKELIKNSSFYGILCLTNASHFSFRKISSHFLQKNKHVQGIPIREKTFRDFSLYVVHYRFLARLFKEIGYPLSTQSKLSF
jgi:hypothetical protein